MSEPEIPPREHEIQSRALLELSRGLTRLFRCNTGMGWAGNISERGKGWIKIFNPRPLHAGLTVGGSDTIGWTSVEITPQMIGKRVAVFTAIEFKAPGKYPSREQRNFLEIVREAGGIGGVAHSVDDAVKIVTTGRIL